MKFLGRETFGALIIQGILFEINSLKDFIKTGNGGASLVDTRFI